VDDKIDVVVLVNGESVSPDEIGIEVASYFIPGLSPKRRAITLSTSALAPYAGRYQVTPTNILTIAVDGTGLSMQSSEGYGQFHLQAETPQVFFISPETLLERYSWKSDSGQRAQSVRQR
jgi:hypothetical protein